MKILITGGGGFLGSALTRHFLQQDRSVSLLLRPGSRLDRLAGHELESVRIERCGNDLQIQEFIRMVRPEVVIHTACAYGRNGESLTSIIDTNLRLGAVLLEALLSLGQPVTFVNTGTALEASVSPYALSKQQFVAWGKLIAEDLNGQIKFINICLQHMYGPGDDPSKFTTMVLKGCQENQAVLELTAGNQQRDFVYIDDVVSAYDLIVRRRYDFDAFEQVDVGSGDAPTVKEMVETIHQLTGSGTKLKFGAVPYRANESMYCKADVTRLKSLGWVPQYDMRSGIRKTIELGI